MDQFPPDLFESLSPGAKRLVVDVGRRLLLGEERYGGFKFAEYDLDHMAVEEIEDFLVYIVAKTFVKLEKEKNEPKGP